MMHIFSHDGIIYRVTEDAPIRLKDEYGAEVEISDLDPKTIADGIRRLVYVRDVMGVAAK